jgi:DNA-binding NarL/FixJ family response regulator
VASRTDTGASVSDDQTVRRILIVDDDQRFRGIARALLECEGFDVVGEAEDGEAAIAAVRRLEPDVVLLDVQLPGINGFEVAERLAAEEGGPAVVFTSTRDESDFGSRLYEHGARGFVPKGDLSAERIASLCG